MSEGGPESDVGAYIRQLADIGQVRLARDGRTPINPVRLEARGAPVIEEGHQFVIENEVPKLEGRLSEISGSFPRRTGE